MEVTRFHEKVLLHFAAYMQWFPPVGSPSMREPLHICSRMEVAPFRIFFDMLKVCNCMPKQLFGPRDPITLCSESDVFDDFMCFEMCFTVLS